MPKLILTEETLLAHLTKKGPKTSGDIATYFGVNQRTEYSLVGQLLQKLKKAGKVSLLKGNGTPQWAAQKRKQCPTCKGVGHVPA